MNEGKMRVQEVIVVEGKYDAAKLAGIVDGLILPVGGFSVFSSDETKALLRRLGKERGLIILTDSDAAGFRIRAYINQIARGLSVKNAYVPACEGKERRKAKPSKEGLLGVEGIEAQQIRRALQAAGVCPAAQKKGRAITYTDLYDAGLSGGAGSAERRRAWLDAIGLPPRLSKKGLLEVLNGLYTYEEFMAVLPERRTGNAGGMQEK